MKINKKMIWNVLTILLWVSIGSGVVVLLVSAVRKEQSKLCKEVVVEFKDNKIRVQIFDDGNVYKSGYYSGSVYISGVSARAYHLKSYFSRHLFGC